MNSLIEIIFTNTTLYAYCEPILCWLGRLDTIV